MIRLVFLLLVAIGLTLLILGEDHGQVRAGLQGGTETAALAEPVAAAATEPVTAPTAEPAPQPVAEPAAAPAPVASSEPADAATPAEPVAQPVAEAVPVADAPTQAEATAEPPAEPAPEPAAAAGPRIVAAEAARVRSGPGRTFAVVGRLAAGETADILPDDTPENGWRHVRLADGTEGWVADQLVAPAP